MSFGAPKAQSSCERGGRARSERSDLGPGVPPPMGLAAVPFRTAAISQVGGPPATPLAGPCGRVLAAPYLGSGSAPEHLRERTTAATFGINSTDRGSVPPTRGLGFERPRFDLTTTGGACPHGR